MYDDLLNAPTWEIEALQRAIPEYFARHNMQAAQAEAYARNRNGGKRKPTEPPKEPPLEGDELYTALEVLEPHSYFVDVKPELKKQTFEDIKANQDALPKWCKELLSDYMKGG